MLRTMRLVAALCVAVFLALGCGPSGYVRPSEGCKCAQMMGGEGKCKCNHCAGETGAKCYCGTGGCQCGAKMPVCQCAHCTGVEGADDGQGNCLCTQKSHKH